ncbi:MAG: HmuY family protein [Chitinophagaceae bacterium]|nr:HmuY family protein [Chitinophagaceae bacterium]
MNLFRLGLVFCLSIVLFSCEKKETPIQLPPKGDGTMMQVEMGEKYEYQFYIDLAKNSIVHISRMDNWDIALQSGNNEHAIYLNGSKSMAAYASGKTDFAAVGAADTIDAAKRWKYDAPGGEPDSTAIGEWKGKNYVYLIRLDGTGNQIRKMQITYEDAFQYIVSIGDLTSTVPASITIEKNKDQNFTYFNFGFLTTVPGVEPEKNSWDIQFTLYHYVFYDQNPPLPYVVNGVLLNPNGISAFKDSVSVYNAIDKNFAQSVPLTTKRDVIGFDWKKYSVDNNVYTIDARYSYIIRNRNDVYFKLRFLDFYGSTGIKGSPKFEFKGLN